MGVKFVEENAKEEVAPMWIAQETFDRVNAQTHQHGVKYVEVEAPSKKVEDKPAVKRGRKPKSEE